MFGGDSGAQAGDAERDGEAAYFARDAWHEIPFRCLVPLGVTNLLVPGRAASSTFEAQSSIRVQQNCHTMGEAAGVAALALRFPGRAHYRRRRDVSRTHGADPAKLAPCDTVELGLTLADGMSLFCPRDCRKMTAVRPVPPDCRLRPRRGLF